MRYAAGLLLLASPALAAEPPVRVVVQPAPPVVMRPSSPPLQLRGPLRVRAATVMTQVMTDMTMRMVEEIPRAVADSVRRGDYKLEFRYSVTPPPEGAAAPAPNQPVRSLLRRLAAPRP